MMIVCKIRQICHCEKSAATSRELELHAGRRYDVQARRPSRAGYLAISTFFRIPRGTTDRVLLGLKMIEKYCTGYPDLV
jgi:hypothetical protein